MLRFLIISALFGTPFGVCAAAPSGDAAWIACTKAPTRACVFDAAFKMARVSPAAAISVGNVLTAYSAADPRGALRLVPSAEAYRKTLSTVDDRAYLDASLVFAYGKAQNFSEAERVLARLKGTTEYDVSAFGLAANLARAQSVPAAVARIRAFGVALKKPDPFSTATNVFFSRVAPLAVARREDGALIAFAHEMAAAAANTSEDVYAPVSAVAFAQLDAGKVQPAFAAASGIPHYASRVSAFGVLGDLVVRAGRVDEALAAALKIENAAERNAALRSMVAPQSADGQVWLFLNTPARLVRPPRTAEAMQLAASLSGEGRDHGHALIARACAVSGAIPEAWRAARKIKMAFSSFYALKAIGTAEAKAGKARASLKTFARARAMARSDATGLMIWDLADVQMSLRQFEAAKAIMREEADKNDGKHASARSALLRAFARAGRVEEAFQTPHLFVEFRREPIARELARGGFTKKAVETIMAGPEPLNEKDRLLASILEELAASGALDNAALILPTISPSRRQAALVELALGYANAGNGAKAPALVREALLLPLPKTEEKDLSERGPTYDRGLEFLLRAGTALPK